jgi:hypothetical protein
MRMTTAAIVALAGVMLSGANTGQAQTVAPSDTSTGDGGPKQFDRNYDGPRYANGVEARWDRSAGNNWPSYGYAGYYNGARHGAQTVHHRRSNIGMR